MQKRDQVVFAALVTGLLIGAASTYALAGAGLSRTTTSTLIQTVTVNQTTTVTSTNPDSVNSSSSLGSSSVFSSSRSTVQQSSAVQYPLAWGPNPLTACAGIAFCINATLGISGQLTSYSLTLSAFVQDAVTGQNATTPSGSPVVESGCDIQPTGFTHCIIGAPYLPVVPSGDPYKVTVFVTQNYLPCSLQKADELCSSQLLAPPSPTVTGDFEG
jgi:hypothetical protein